MCSLEKRDNVYILTLIGDDQHRLNPTLLDAISAALHRVRSETIATSSSSALITTSHGKFFSNGYDLDWSLSDPSRPKIMSLKLRSVIKDLLSLPMPTIAAITGHASAAGAILALSHDYVYMRKDRGFIYMSEVDIGLKLPAWFVTVLRCKIGSPAVWRDLVLRGRKLTAEMAVEKGVIEAACESAEMTVEKAVELGEELVMRRWKGHVYADNRLTVFGDVLKAMEFDEIVEDLDLNRVRNNMARL
ncbi:enoyl-CoA delta isomerase 1, peroxisomal-like [Heracleum sosnowskyi]|uniref:Delta(3)-Delta(2)-enoyl-CoA isomerase n=1 Tax=Heracleum sosnowskyi TaxID=360622 RepID=A0AAD8I4Y6_9APIA|nr:enoyl-CoA delta isomerase 1, peroxisomal-like [Heracleum sosnowskyi]